MIGDKNKFVNIFNHPSAQERLLFFWKGRVALYIILKALGISKEDEVIIPGYTCVVVANAVLYLGAIPIYADIDPLTYTVTSETIEPLITNRTKAIIAQNTFGLSPDLDPIMDLANKYGLYVIEDCAHGLGGSYKGRPAGTNTHAAFFSTQWSKPITTGVGGMAYISDDGLLQKVSKLAAQLDTPNTISDLILAGQRLVYPLVNNKGLYYPLVKMYRFITQNLGLSVGSSVSEELNGTEMPDNYLKAMGKFQRVSVNYKLNSLKKSITLRKTISKNYDQFFMQLGIKIPYRPNYADHTMLRYTIRINNKKDLLEKAQQLRIPIGDWFISPLHPVKGDLNQWMYKSGQCPEAEKACRENINLLPDQKVEINKLERLFSK